MAKKSNSTTPKESKKLAFTVERSVRAVHLRFYAEQVGWSAGTSMAGPDQDKAEQIKALTDFFNSLQLLSVPFNWGGIIHDEDTKLGKSESETDFWVPAIEKPHGHLVLWISDNASPYKLRTIFNILAQAGFAYRKGNPDDFELIKKGIRFPKKQKKEHFDMFVYLTHETFEATNEGKHQYSRDRVFSNLSDADKVAIYRYYENKIASRNGSKSADVDVFEAARQLGRECKSFADWWNNPTQVHPVQQMDRTLRLNCIDAYNYGVAQFMAEHMSEPLDRVAIFIDAPGGSGKTQTTKNIFKEWGKKLYSVNGTKTSKTDDLDASYDALEVSDASLPDLLNMADQTRQAVYKRGSGRPIFAGDWLIISNNGSFLTYCSEKGYTKTHNASAIAAASSRFFHCIVDDTRHLQLVMPPVRFTDEDTFVRLCNKFKDFQKAYNENIDKFLAKPQIDPMEKARELFPDMVRLPSEYFDIRRVSCLNSPIDKN